ncbi:MAG TPA: hypothetical protein VGE76_23030 [Opitutaceae bacterium]
MMTGRKVRSDAKLEQLTAEQKEQLRAWLEDENLSYVKAAARVQAEFGLSVGKSAVAGFWQRYVVPRRFFEDVASSEEFASLPAEQFLEAAMKVAKGMIFSALNRPAPDIRTACRLVQMVSRVERLELAHRRQSLAERRAVLAEKRAEHVAARAKAKLAPKRDEGSSQAEKARALREMFVTDMASATGPAPENPPLYPGLSAVSRDCPEAGLSELREAV